MQQQTDGKRSVCVCVVNGGGEGVASSMGSCGRLAVGSLGRFGVPKLAGSTGTGTIHHPYDKQSKAIVLSSSSLLLN